MKKVAILSACVGLTDIVRVFEERLHRAIAGADTINSFITCMVATERDKHKVDDVLFYKNSPLGEKWNVLCEYVGKVHNPDYIMILGSDDMISSSMLELIDHKINQGYEFIAFNDIYFYSLNPKRIKFSECGYWAGRGANRALGPGRVCCKGLLDEVKWRPWGGTINSGLDGSFWKNIRGYVNEEKKTILSLRATSTYCVDIKTIGNINGIGNLELQSEDPVLLLSKFMDSDEVERIMDIKKSL
jgi:hypothetical protein